MSGTTTWNQTNGYQNCHQQLWTISPIPQNWKWIQFSSFSRKFSEITKTEGCFSSSLEYWYSGQQKTRQKKQLRFFWPFAGKLTSDSAKIFWRNFWRAHGQCIRHVLEKYSAIEFMEMFGLEKKMKQKFYVIIQNVRSFRKNVKLIVENLLSKTIYHDLFLLSLKFGLLIIHHWLIFFGYQAFLPSDYKTKAGAVALFVDQEIKVQVKGLKNHLCFVILAVEFSLPCSQNFLGIVTFQ